MRGLAALVAALVLPAVAAAGAPVATSRHAELRLLPGWAESDGRRVAGLEIVLAPGWKTYWRAPGEGGLAPEFDWSGSSNVASVAVEWPRPALFEAFGVRTVGYADAVVLPLVIEPMDPAEPIRLALDLHYGVCAEICVPEQATLALNIPTEALGDVVAIRTHRDTVPGEAGVTAARCGVRGAGVSRRFAAQVDLAEPRPAPFVLVEGPANAWVGPVEVAQQGHSLAASAEVQVHGEPQWIARDSLRLTLLWPDHAIDVQGCAALGP